MSSLEERICRQLTDIQEKHLLRSPVITEVQPDGMCTRDGRELVNFGSNDYLGLAAVSGTGAATGLGAAASALVGGRSAAYDRLEAVRQATTSATPVRVRVAMWQVSRRARA